jgi:hypothetical protein
MNTVETRFRPLRAEPVLQAFSGFCRIRLESGDSTMSVDFRDRRSMEILNAISREVVCFRREQAAAAECPYGISMSAPFLEWFGLVLGDVYTDRFDPAEFLSESDLKHAFGLRIMRASAVSRLCPGRTYTGADGLSGSGEVADFSGSPIVADLSYTSVRSPVELDLLLPPLWQISRSRKHVDSILPSIDCNSSGGELCFLRKLPSGLWQGRILSADESKGFRQMVPYSGVRDRSRGIREHEVERQRRVFIK